MFSILTFKFGGTKPDGRPRSATGIDAAIPRHPLLSHPVTLVLGAAILISLPILLFGFPNAADTEYHLLWHMGFAEQFWNGELYPRWLRDVAWGHGGPVFFFYPPVGFYASALAGKLFVADPLGRYALAAATLAALALSGGTAHLWLRTMAGPRAAITGAILYMVVPYHLAIDLYLRAAYAEIWSFVWMPLVLYFIRRSRDWRVAAPIGLAASYCGLIMSHLPVTLLFSPLAGAFTLMLFARDKATLLRCGFGLALAVLMASVYLLPAMLYQDLTSAQLFWRPFQFAFSPSFVMEKLALESGMSDKFAILGFEIVLYSSFLLVAYAIRLCWFARSATAPDDRRQFNFWLWACVAIFILATPLSAFVWDILPLLKKVQFAWRLHAVLCVAVLPIWAFAVEASLKLDRDRQRGIGVSCGLLVVASLVLVFGAIGNPTRFDPEEARAKVAQSSGFNELLLPKSAAPLVSDREGLDPSLLHAALRPRLAPNRPKAWLVDGDAAIRVTDWAPRRISLRVDAPRASRIAVRQLFFAGWVAKRDGACCLAVSPHPSNAVVTVDAPEGVYRLDLVLTKGRIERLGEWLSAAGLVLLLAFGGFGWLRRRRS